MLRSGLHAMFVVLPLTLPAAAQRPFCDQLRALTLGPEVAGAHWGVMVATLDGSQLCGLNEAQLFRPASNNKLFTGAAALALLGADKRFETRAVAVGEMTGGVLHGSLELVGGGDANFGAHDIPYIPPALRLKNPQPEPATIADIEDLADKVVAAGVRRIEGDILGNDTYFAWEPYPPDWAADDLLWGYGAPVSALTLHDNEVVYSVTPGAKPGGRAILSATPDVPYYTLNANVYVASFDGGCDDRLGYQRAAGSKLLQVFGDIKSQAQPCRQAIAIENPAEYAALALKQALERRGVQISGDAKAKHAEMRTLGPVIRDDPSVHFMLPRTILNAPYEADRKGFPCQVQTVTNGQPEAERTVLAIHVSPRLAEDLTYTLKVSQNLHAELLLRNLGATFDCEHTQSAGVAVVKEYLLHAGLDPKDFKLYDGSGLSGHDLVTPRALTKLLAYAATQPWFATYKAALPVAGVDGSLGGRFAVPDAPLKGKVFAKTGTLSETRALSGYVTAASGQTLIFSILVDDHLPGPPADRAIMDRMVELIAAAN